MTRALHILGRGRSGSTLLDLALGSMEGLFSAGELHRLWAPARPRDSWCPCGKRVVECPVWAPFAGTPPRSAAQLADVYVRLAEAVGARVVIDSSKRVLTPGPTGRLPGVESFAVHLVRDPRAVTFSEGQRLQGPGRLPRLTAKAAAWRAYNLLVERTLERRLPGRWMRVRYEDLVSQPVDVLERIAGFVDVPQRAPAALTAGRIEVTTHHMVGKARSRWQEGPFELVPDRRWEQAMAPAEARLATALAGGTGRRYGYSPGDTIAGAAP
jgi:hypothetical protein